MRYQFTDESWAVFHDFLLEVPGNRCGQKPKLPERMFFEAILYVARTSIPWRDLPGEFGCWLAVYQRFRRWVDSGRLARLFDRLTDAPAFGDVKRVLIDSTIVRAHQHAAGAVRKKSTARPPRHERIKPLDAAVAA